MRRWSWILAVLLWAACSDSTNPDNGAVAESDLNIVRFTSTNAVTVKTASFWAVRGQNRKLEMFYANGDRFLEFESRNESLLARPNGTLFATGDSVLITVTLDPTDRIIVHFEPSGLTFNPADPARLKINYKQANRDIDNDGDQDSHDLQLEATLRIWEQERTGLPWLPLVTLRLDAEELEGRVLGFTGFAMASN
ncbi:MAG TPA: hypothetical protein VF021_02005 [Longimicrobiales bacterium]